MYALHFYKARRCDALNCVKQQASYHGKYLNYENIYKA